MTPHESLSLAEAILGAIFLSLTVYNISRTPRETAWWYITVFCLCIYSSSFPRKLAAPAKLTSEPVRTTGSSLLLAVSLNNDYTNKALLVPAIILSGIAISPLLAASLGFLNSWLVTSYPISQPRYIHTYDTHYAGSIHNIILTEKKVPSIYQKPATPFSDY